MMFWNPRVKGWMFVKLVNYGKSISDQKKTMVNLLGE